ncbi:MAG: hypothetical protein NZ735_05620 [Candidatus Marinimicrobia bacterium]|nr:hypothetical protein [Candidatus Neomarinimicrobiota bacterium]
MTNSISANKITILLSGVLTLLLITSNNAYAAPSVYKPKALKGDPCAKFIKNKQIRVKKLTGSGTFGEAGAAMTRMVESMSMSEYDKCRREEEVREAFRQQGR